MRYEYVCVAISLKASNALTINRQRRVQVLLQLFSHCIVSLVILLYNGDLICRFGDSYQQSHATLDHVWTNTLVRMFVIHRGIREPNVKTRPRDTHEIETREAQIIKCVMYIGHLQSVDGCETLQQHPLQPNWLRHIRVNRHAPRPISGIIYIAPHKSRVLEVTELFLEYMLVCHYIRFSSERLTSMWDMFVICDC